MTLTSGGSTRLRPSRRGWVTHSALVWLPATSGGPDRRQSARNGGPSISLWPTGRSVTKVPAGSLKTVHVLQRSQETRSALRADPSRSLTVMGL
ncbi:MAG: hypothetical protein BWY94_02250 [Actinobacteria bacterium ADurb.BinA094]|nr:MAG: hypothetical protein BWY94_02250 [Actinobacteria bacterium ADurb.BinA094]